MSQNVPSGSPLQLVAQGNGRPDGDSELGCPYIPTQSGQISLRNPLPVCRNTLHPEIRSTADIELVINVAPTRTLFPHLI